MSNKDKKIDISEPDKDFLKNKILDLESQFKTIEKKIDIILELLEKDCKKMSDHIDFVENVYENIKRPFYYVMNRVSYFVSSHENNILNCEDNSEKKLL